MKMNGEIRCDKKKIVNIYFFYLTQNKLKRKLYQLWDAEVKKKDKN